MISILDRNTAYSSASLETDRLFLAVPTLDDFEEMLAMWSDVNVAGPIIGRPLTEEEVWARLHRIVGHWALMGFGHWIVREKHGGKFSGELGFFKFKRKLGPEFDDAHEIGWMFTADSQGKGYATEAAKAGLTWLERDGQCRETVCLIPPENVASLALANKLSYVITDEIIYRDKAMLLLRRGAKQST